jgi:phosphate transport system substrate-binding protein
MFSASLFKIISPLFPKRPDFFTDFVKKIHFNTVPGEKTAANKNFRRQVMKHKDIESDFVANNSVTVIEAVKYFPCETVSFISQGAALNEEAITTIKINGLSPQDKDYPYYQIFYYVTKGEPAGSVKQFVDFTFSEKGAALIKAHGMLPITR